MDYMYLPNAFSHNSVAPLFIYCERNTILLRKTTHVITRPTCVGEMTGSNPVRITDDPQ
jgi:hypothetical protein